MPVADGAGRGRVILVDIPERAVVDRVHAHGRVVTPAWTQQERSTLTCLRVCAEHERRFRLRQLVQWIADQSPGVENTWEGLRTRSAKPKRSIPDVIGGDAAHPAVQYRI